jgi:hypothetical protein
MGDDAAMVKAARGRREIGRQFGMAPHAVSKTIPGTVALRRGDGGRAVKRLVLLSRPQRPGSAFEHGIKGIHHVPPQYATFRKRVPAGVQIGAHL